MRRYLSIPMELQHDFREGEFTEGITDAGRLMIEALEKENLQPVLTFLSKAAQDAKRLKQPGPLVPDVVAAQALAFQNATGMKSFDMMQKEFNWIADLDDDGVPVVTPGRPTMRRGTGRPYQLRFKTRGDALYFDFIRLIQTLGGAGRTPDEYFRIAMTMQPFVPEGYEARYRAHANALAYVMGLETPSRLKVKAEERGKLKKQVQRKAERAN